MWLFDEQQRPVFLALSRNLFLQKTQAFSLYFHLHLGPLHFHHLFSTLRTCLLGAQNFSEDC